MCGIIGIISQKNVSNDILEGLKRLEYRGYDSAGIATIMNGAMDRRRAEGKLKNLEERLKREPLNGTIGIGHTRWATHGQPTENNAHPHLTDKVAVVHNGIIENYLDLKQELESHQYRFETQTDTEVIAHLVTHYLKQTQDPWEAVRQALEKLKGAFAIAIMFSDKPDLMIGARQGTPLALGYGASNDNGQRDMFLASDSYALAPFTKDICFLEDGDRVVIDQNNVSIFDQAGQEVKRDIRKTAQSGLTSGKGAYRHFMLKEIFEQPEVISDTLNSYINPSTGDVTIPADILSALETAPKITMVACGTAFYACLVAKYWFEKIARIPCEVDIASEFRYREAPLPEKGVCVFVSQSGETLDTLEALRYCKSQDQIIISIVNTIESTIERESHHVLYTLAGPEIGVASTKALTTQLTTLACVALAVAAKKGAIDNHEVHQLSNHLRHVPKIVASSLSHDKDIHEIAKDISMVQDVLYLGRGQLYPIALEGALKLKEISYIHAEGYAAGEMKHGPIALIDDTVPVVSLVPANDVLFEKTVSNIQETIARGGKICAITDQSGHERLKDEATWNIVVDDVDPFVSPIVYCIPVQLLAYYVAVEKGTDVDQPRNLAKSVTVE